MSMKTAEALNALTLSSLLRFHASYRRGAPEECWPWLLECREKGYGRFYVVTTPKRRTQAHRLAYALANGPFDWSLHVLHRCDNPRCVNPGHLFLGTNCDNIADALAKGRGSRAVLRKLDNTQVREIRARRASGQRVRDLAREYGMSSSAISRICLRKRWKDI